MDMSLKNFSHLHSYSMSSLPEIQEQHIIGRRKPDAQKPSPTLNSETHYKCAFRVSIRNTWFKSWSFSVFGVKCSEVVTLKMEAAKSSETLIPYHITTWHHNLDHDLNVHCHEDLSTARNKWSTVIFATEHKKKVEKSLFICSWS
jgi:hypothetical protein